MPPDHYPATVYRYTKTRGWERYRASTPQFARRRLLAAAGQRRQGGVSVSGEHEVQPSSQTVCAVPRRGCVEVRALRLRIRLFAEEDPNDDGGENGNSRGNEEEGEEKKEEDTDEDGGDDDDLEFVEEVSANERIRRNIANGPVINIASQSQSQSQSIMDTFSSLSQSLSQFHESQYDDSQSDDGSYCDQEDPYADDL